jgi:cephalosporin-C deacetylase-like acetyl esterase
MRREKLSRIPRLSTTGSRTSKGQRIRTIVTRPKNASGKVPVIFFVGWLSCDSVEYSNGETDGFGAIFWRLIEQSGFATMRMDKPGVGESEGDCAKTDFQTELDSYRAAFDSLKKYSFVDESKIFVVGLSNGGERRRSSAGRTLYADSWRRVPGGALGTSTCWNSSAGGFRDRQSCHQLKSMKQ